MHQIQTNTQPNTQWRQLALTWSTAPALYGLRPSRCPECGAATVTAQFGSAHCRTCGHKWPYGEVQS